MLASVVLVLRDRCRRALGAPISGLSGAASSFKPPDAGLVHFNLSQENAELRVGETQIVEALELLGGPWLSTLASVDDEGITARYVPAAAGRVVAQRLRWLAEAFDEATDDEIGSSGSA